MSALMRWLIAIYIASVMYYFFVTISSSIDWPNYVDFLLYVMSIAMGYFFWIATKNIKTEKGLLRYIVIGIGSFGLVSLIYGVIIPMALSPNSGQEVIAGLFYILPWGVIVGGVFGSIFWVYNQRKIEGSEKYT